MKKRTFYTELVYIFGLVILALGTALMERANFGMSMVVAPAYIFHLKLVGRFPFFTFGMAEYCLQAVLLVILGVAMRGFKKGYMFSFVTAVLYGFTLDACMWLVSFMPGSTIPTRIVLFIAGMVTCSVGVAMLFHTYLAPEAYELVVKELSGRMNKDIALVKTAYDLISLGISVILSFLFFGWLHFEGVKLGTLITALVNGWMIGRISKWLEQKYEFEDRLPLRKVFDN